VRIERQAHAWHVIYQCEEYGDLRLYGLLQETTQLAELLAEFPGAEIVGTAAERKLSPQERTHVRVQRDQAVAERDAALAELARVREQVRELQGLAQL